MDLIYYHNPNCSKSRQGLDILNESNITYNIHNLKQKPLTKKKLEEIYEILADKKRLLCRLNDTEIRTFGKNERDQIINAILDQPKELQRPILVKNNKAYICRPAERLHDLLCQ